MSTSKQEQDGLRPVYQNNRYWTERLEREFTLAGVGRAGVGLAFNTWAYAVRRRVLLHTLAEHKIAVNDARLLELGFGTGFYVDLWREQSVQHVTGFDVTEIAVNAARERFAQSGWRFEQADIGAPLPLQDAQGRCDIATAFDVLFHLVEDGNWNSALDNLAGAVRPGGHVLIFDKYQPVENKIGHMRRRTLEAYNETLEKRGFEIVCVRPIFFLMKSPADLRGFAKLLFNTNWWLVKDAVQLGKHIGWGSCSAA